MFSKTALEEMLVKQDELNTLTCGKSWRNGICQNSDKAINWRLAILDEASELLNSTEWKHWKFTKADPWNEKLELIDLWHFVLSYALSKAEKDEIIKFTNGLKVKHLYPPEASKSGLTIKLVSTDEWKEMIVVLLSYGRRVKMSTEDVRDLYQLKNWLNTFRMDNGYRTGTYFKEWTPQDSLVEMEDNHILARFLESEGTQYEAKKRFVREYSKLQKE